MDYLLKNRLVSCAGEILDSVSQQPVDLDFTLPDYCADVEKILKCSLIPKIYSRSLSAGQLTVDGVSLIRILYTDSNRSRLRCCEQTVPFSQSIPVSTEASDNVIFTTPKPEYLNCRALSPRRLTLHGAFSLHTKVLSRSMTCINEDNADDDLQLLNCPLTAMEVCSFAQEQFSVAESAVLKTKSSVETIVRSDVQAIITDCTNTGDRVMLKGEITLSMLYISDASTGDTDRLVYAFPFSTTLSTGDKECSHLDARVDVLSYEILLKSELMSEEPVVTVDVKLSATVVGYKSHSISPIVDAYSTVYNTDSTLQSVPVCKDISIINSSYTSKSTVSMGDETVEKILDIFTEAPIFTGNFKEDTLCISGKVNVCVLACDKDGKIICIERQVDISREEVLSGKYSSIKHMKGNITSLSYRITESDALELRLDVRLYTVLQDEILLNQISQVKSIGETMDKEAAPLTLYFAKSGEKVWDIAKHFSAPLSTLCTENSIDTEVIETDGMLFVLRV